MEPFIRLTGRHYRGIYVYLNTSQQEILNICLIIFINATEATTPSELATSSATEQPTESITLHTTGKPTGIQTTQCPGKLVYTSYILL